MASWKVSPKGARVVDRTDAHLLLVGLSVEGVTDDPEGAVVPWPSVSTHGGSARRRPAADPGLVSLPMDDFDENAAMVNVLQRHATVVVQKSLAEGFGLTVAEAMWKAKPVVASAVGGIVDQIGEGTGILLPEPADLAAFGSAARLLLGDPAQAARMGQAAHAHVRENYVGHVHLMRYGRLLVTLTGEG